MANRKKAPNEIYNEERALTKFVSSVDFFFGSSN